MKAIYIRTRYFTDAIFSYLKNCETRNSRTLDQFIGETVGVILTGCGKPKLIGTVKITGRYDFKSYKDFDRCRAMHQVQKGTRWDTWKGYKAGYWLEDPVRFAQEIELKPVKGNRIWREI